MTREILFRGKRVDTGEWVEGYFAEIPINTIYGPHLGRVIYKKPESVYHSERYEVIPETVCQYTGLTDKNGQRIFEGDLIRNQDGDIGRVTWYPEHAAFMIYCLNTNKVHFLYNNDFSKIEVFDNIHDNPDLFSKEETTP